MKCRMRPIGDALDVPVLEGIEVNVIDVPLQIAFVSNRVFPEPSLPNSAFASVSFAVRTPAWRRVLWNVRWSALLGIKSFLPRLHST
jgi:hypothetical protein